MVESITCSGSGIFALLFCISAACVLLPSCPSVSQSWSTPAVMVENRGPTKTPNKALFDKANVPTTSDQINPFELADLTKIDRAGWLGRGY